MTTRRWMIAVAIMAADFWVSVLGARSHSYAIRAGDHGLMEAHNRWIIEEIEAGRLFYSGPMDQLTLRANRCRRLIAYHATPRQTYESASRRPRLPVEPDPPEPR